MYNRVFTWVETRAKSELRVRLVPLNALQFFFSLAQISSIVVLNVKNLAFTPFSVCVLLVVVVGGGGGSRRYNHMNIYHDPAFGYSITCVDRPRCWRGGGGGGQWLQMHFTLTTRVGICVRYITMEMSTDVK